MHAALTVCEGPAQAGAWDTSPPGSARDSRGGGRGGSVCLPWAVSSSQTSFRSISLVVSSPRGLPALGSRGDPWSRRLSPLRPQGQNKNAGVHHTALRLVMGSGVSRSGLCRYSRLLRSGTSGSTPGVPSPPSPGSPGSGGGSVCRRGRSPIRPPLSVYHNFPGLAIPFPPFLPPLTNY